MNSKGNQSLSPEWGETTKLIIGLTFVAIAAALIVRFNNLLGPLILTFILSYSLHPAISGIKSRTGLSWRAAVSLVFLLLLIIVLVFFTASGVAVVNQLQSLVTVVQNFIVDLP
ncbi:MAG: hypothetical protein N2D54_07605 [Chloroflexota bacterium]